MISHTCASPPPVPVTCTSPRTRTLRTWPGRAVLQSPCRGTNIKQYRSRRRTGKRFVPTPLRSSTPATGRLTVTSVSSRRVIRSLASSSAVVLAGLLLPPDSSPPSTEPGSETTEGESIGDSTVPATDAEELVEQGGSPEFERKLAELAFALFLGNELDVDAGTYSCTEPSSLAVGETITCFTLIGSNRVVVATTELTGTSGVYEFEIISDHPIDPAESTTTVGADIDRLESDDDDAADVVHRHHDGAADAGGHRPVGLRRTDQRGIRRPRRQPHLRRRRRRRERRVLVGRLRRPPSRCRRRCRRRTRTASTPRRGSSPATAPWTCGIARARSGPKAPRFVRAWTSPSTTTATCRTSTCASRSPIRRSR